MIPVIFLLMLPIISSAQDFKEHRWVHRILIIITDDKHASVVEDQIRALKEHLSGLDERKLMVYQTTPEEFKKGLDSNEWQSSKQLYQKYKRFEKPFETVLIGLDGQVKRREPGIFPPEELFAIIDSMPMRRAELSNEN